jgi:hypothetical protein
MSGVSNDQVDAEFFPDARFLILLGECLDNHDDRCDEQEGK